MFLYSLALSRGDGGRRPRRRLMELYEAWVALPHLSDHPFPPLIYRFEEPTKGESHYRQSRRYEKALIVRFH